MIPSFLRLCPEVKDAIFNGAPVVALESTVITHGLPYPDNIATLHSLEAEVRANGAIPATIIALNGILYVGLSDIEIGKIEADCKTKKTYQKLSMRDLALAVANASSGGTTVSATMKISHLCGIKVFATGGIGGIHRDWQSVPDISMDLEALASIPMIVVSAGCKAILDIEATLEWLESRGITIYGWNTNTFPAFYSSSSKFSIPAINSLDLLCTAFQTHLTLNNQSAILIANPVNKADEIPAEDIEPIIVEAISNAKRCGITGKALTPFLLQFLAEATRGHSVKANLALLHNNAALGAKIAQTLARQ